MKVAHKSDDHLTVESKPWFITGLVWLMGLGAILGGMVNPDMALAERILVVVLGVAFCAAAWWLMPFISLDFDRPKGTLTVTHARITGAHQNLYNLADIDRSLVQYDTTDGADLERLALLTGKDVTPVEFGFSSASRRNVMAEINAWLEMEKEA